MTALMDPPIPGAALRTPPEGVRRTFLPEVQALRAVAVLLVVAYHLRPDLVPGGFIGVDVFFVISGYLITGHMVREVREHGRLRLARFWANRVRRILPASLLAILFVVATAPIVVPITEWDNQGRQAIASVFYVQNWVLAADSVDYSASDTAATPFQHFWSLAVEEQFYLLWPLVVLAAAVVAARWAKKRSAAVDHLKVCLLVAFGVLVVASFGWSVVQVAAEDPAAYFVTTTRLWELGFGGVLAVVLRYTDGLATVRSVLALAGLAAIAVGGLTLSDAVPFPGMAAMLPVLGSAAVITAGRTSGPGSLTLLVDRAPVQWVGNVSYSLYLWHFPIVIYFTTAVGRNPSALEAVSLLAVMLVASAASYSFVEQPFRKAAWAGRSDRRVLIAALLAMVLVAGSASAFWIGPIQLQRARAASTEQAVAEAKEKGRFGAASPRAGRYRAFVGKDRLMAPDPIAAKQSDMFLDTLEGRCEPKRSDRMPRRCDFGNPNSQTVIAVVGDSHARMYIPAVLLAAEQHGWHLVTFIKTSCPYSKTARTIPTGAECLAANNDTERRLADLGTDLVVTALYSGSRFVDDGGAQPGATGLTRAWRQQVRSGSRVVVIKDAPLLRKDVMACVAQNYDAPGQCSNRRKKALTTHHDLVDTAAAGIKNVEVLDLSDRFCKARSCPPVIGNVLVYLDGNHISRTYSESLAPDVERALADAVSR